VRRGRTRQAWAVLRCALCALRASMRRRKVLLTAQRARQARVFPRLGAWRSRRASARWGTRGATADPVQDVGRGRTRTQLGVQRVRRVHRVRSQVVPAPVPARVVGRTLHRRRGALPRAIAAAHLVSGGIRVPMGKFAPCVLLGRTRTLLVVQSARRAQEEPLSQSRGVPQWETASRLFLLSLSPRRCR
jgi:hypothetical protein